MKAPTTDQLRDSKKRAIPVQRDAGLSIFDFTNYLSFLSAVGARRRGAIGGRRITLEKWAKRLGYRSPSSMAMILKGQRLPTAGMVELLSRDLALRAEEKHYFHLLVLLEREKRANRDIRPILTELSALNPKKGSHTRIDHETFSAISDWFHIVIKQLVATPGFREDPQWISRRLGRRITPAQARQAIETLLSTGMLSRAQETGALEVSKTKVRTATDIPSAAIRAHHSGMISRTMEALAEQPVHEREISSMTLRCDPKRMGEIKEWIGKTKLEFDRLFSSDDSEQVYQFNVQFFAHTSTLAREDEKHGNA